MNDTIKLLDSALANSTQEDKADVDDINDSAVRTANALSSVINYIITDAFNLEAEESLWVGYHLGEILSPLKNVVPTALMAAVDRELACNEYSNRMMRRLSSPTFAQAYDDASFNTGVKYAPVSDWVEGISEIVLGSYPTLRPMIRSSIVGSIHGLFMELGVSDNPRKSRASSYLPNSVRYLLGNGE